MRIGAKKLPRQLARELAPAYLIAGDEQLLVGEAVDAVLAKARGSGYTERDRLVVSRGFDWGQLAASGSTMSLFAERRIVELRMPTGRPGKAGGEAIRSFVADPPVDTLLLVVSGRLDRSGANSAWAKAIAGAGVFVQVWPVDTSQLPAWIAERMRIRGLAASRDALELLAERCEGNLLSANQEIEKLLLAHGPGNVGEDEVYAAVADSARFDAFQLADAALTGDARRALRVLDGLREEGVEPVLILGALCFRMRSLAGVMREIEQGTAEQSAMRSVRQSAQPVFRRAQRRFRETAAVHAVFLQAARTDRILKGNLSGQPWEALTSLVAAIAGTPPQTQPTHS